MSVFSRFAQKFYVPLAGKARQLSTTLVRLKFNITRRIELVLFPIVLLTVRRILAKNETNVKPKIAIF